MNKPAGNNLPDQPDAWTGPEERRCPIVEKVRDGPPLTPEARPRGAEFEARTRGTSWEAGNV